MAKPLTTDTQVVDSSPKRKILHVEDSAEFARIVRLVLESRDYAVTQAADGLSGLIAFNQEPEQWSAVILDLSLPHFSGAALLNEMHRIRPDLPLIVLTGDRSDDTLELYGKGAVIVWHKPITGQDLVENLKAVLG